MNNKAILSKAWHITWQRKYLWLFGFLAALNVGLGDGDNPFLQGGAWLFQNLDTLLSPRDWSVLLILGIALGFWVLGSVGRGSLIFEVAALDSGRPKPIREVGGLFAVGWRCLPRILGMQALIWLPLAVLEISFVLLAQSGVLALGVSWLVAVGLVLLALPLTFIDTFAYRSIVLEELGIVASVRRAVQILKEHLRDILVLTLIYLFLALLVSFIVTLILSPVLLIVTRLLEGPLLSLSAGVLESMNQCKAYIDDFAAFSTCMQGWEVAPLLMGISIFGSILGAAVSAVWVTFQSATFTLVYRSLTRKRRKQK